MLDLFRTLPGILGNIEGAEMVREAVVFAAWRRVAGDDLVRHAVPVRLEDSTLAVAVSNLTWQRHLKDLCAQMVFKVNATLGAPLVTRIELEIDERRVLAERPNAAADEERLRRMAESEISPLPQNTSPTRSCEDSSCSLQVIAL